MNPYYKFLYVIAPLLLSLGGLHCRKPIDKTDVIVAVEKEFTVQSIEHLTAQDNGLALVVASVDNQACGQTGIKSVVTQKDKAITISLQALIQPLVCDNKPSPARDTIHLGALTEGVYDFQLNLKNVVINKGRLVVSNTGYLLTMDKEDGFIIAQKELKKIPKGLIWGYVATDNTAQLTVFWEALSRLSATANLDWGHYGFFNIRSGNFELLTKMTSNKSEIRTFCLKLTGQKSDLETVLAPFKGSDLIDFQIFTADGDFFSN